MHELHEVRSLVERAQHWLRPGQRIRHLRIAVGEASGHSPVELEAAFPLATAGTAAEGATLEVTIEKLSARCGRCGSMLQLEAFALTCPVCGSTEMDILAGEDVRLVSVEP